MFDAVGVSPSTTEALHEMRILAATTAGADMRQVGDTELMGVVVEIDRVRRLLDATEAHALVELDARGTTEVATGMRTGAWAGRETNNPPGPCKARVALARRLRSTLPLVDEALTSGRINVAHARVLDRAANPRIADAIAALCPELIDASERIAFEQWRLMVEAIAQQLDQDGGYNPGEDETNNRLHLRGVGQGITDVRGAFVEASALALRQLLETEADRLRREHQQIKSLEPDHEIPCRSQLMAEALLNLCRQGAGVDLASSRPPRPEVVIVTHTDRPDEAYTLDGQPLFPSTLRLVGCGADTRRLTMDRAGNLLFAGNSIRFANAAQRRALAIRDGGCVFPGCDCPASWADAHHVVHVEDGGPTDIDNLALLCRFHHGVTHRTGWAMHAGDDQWFYWTTPNGNSFWSQRHGQQRAGPIPLAA